MDNDNDDDCSICGLNLKDKYQYKLPCNHPFHYECLLKTFTPTKQYQINHCPYCRVKCGYLPIVNGLKKITIGVHGTSSELFAPGKSEIKNEPCKAILQKGKNKGNICNKHCLLGFEYCGLHKKYIQ